MITEGSINNAVTALLSLGIALAGIGIIAGVVGLASLAGFRVPADTKNVVHFAIWFVGAGVVFIIISVYLPMFIP